MKMFRNSEGYADPTAGAACAKIAYEEKQRYRKLVYICSPYAGDIDGNTAKARRYSRFAVKQGYVPVAPHLLYPQFLKDADGEREIGLKCGIALLHRCQEMWVFGTVISPGMKAEISEASRKPNLIVRYFDENGKETVPNESI